VHAMKPKERAKLHKQYVGFVFQSYHLLDDLTVRVQNDRRAGMAGFHESTAFDPRKLDGSGNREGLRHPHSLSGHSAWYAVPDWAHVG